VESEDESDNNGRISPEPDCNDHNFDLFSEKEEPCLLFLQPPEVLGPYTPIRSFSGYPLITRHRGFRLCGDNIDNTVHRRYLRLDQQNVSLQYFHTYAIENCIDFTGLSDKSKEHLYVNLSIDDKQSMAVSLLPTPQDDKLMRDNVSKLISLVLVTHLKFFSIEF